MHPTLKIGFKGGSETDTKQGVCRNEKGKELDAPREHTVMKNVALQTAAVAWLK